MDLSTFGRFISILNYKSIIYIQPCSSYYPYKTKLLLYYSSENHDAGSHARDTIPGESSCCSTNENPDAGSHASDTIPGE